MKNSTAIANTALVRNSVSKNSVKKEVKKHWQLYIFLGIPLLYIILFNYVPMAGLAMAFQKFDPRKGFFGSDFVGFKYFLKFFHSPKFSRVVLNTISLSFYQLLASFPIPIIIALGLNSVRHEKFKKVVQTITYMPHFISVIVLVGLLNTLLNPVTGLYGTIFSNLLHLPTKDFLADPQAFRHLYVWSGIWQNCGWGSIIYLAALSSVDKELHEAAEVDGASRFKRVLHIDVQMILPTATIMLIMNAGKIMTLGFEKVYLMQNPLNSVTSEIIATYVYKVGIGSGNANFSYGTAIGFFNSIINLILIVSVNKICKRLSETSLW